MLKVVDDPAQPNSAGGSMLDEIVRDGARQMLAAALQAEVSGAGSPRDLPAWSRKSPRVAEVLPLLYLHGLSSSDFGPALEQFLGSDQGAASCRRPVGMVSMKNTPSAEGHLELHKVGAVAV